MKKTVALVACCLALTACGSSGGRPSVDELSKPMKDNMAKYGGDVFKGDKADKAAECMAKALHDSKLSDDALRAIVKNDTGAKLSKKDESAFASVMSSSTMNCMKDAMDMPSMPSPTTN